MESFMDIRYSQRNRFCKASKPADHNYSQLLAKIEEQIKVVVLIWHIIYMRSNTEDSHSDICILYALYWQCCTNNILRDRGRERAILWWSTVNSFGSMQYKQNLTLYIYPSIVVINFLIIMSVWLIAIWRRTRTTRKKKQQLKPWILIHHTH